MALVQTRQLTKRYRRLTALDDCTLSVSAGEVFGLLGPNGAGKSTLLRLLLGYLKPTSGAATVCGFHAQRQSLQVRRRVAYLPGEVRLFRRMRGRDVIRFLTALHPSGDRTRALACAGHLDLDVHRRVASMSTGMRQKLALAVCLSATTPLLILDEPTSNLDPTVRGTLLELVAEARGQGRTVVFSSHVLSEVEQVCDRVVILRDGRLVHTQVVADLKKRHRIHVTLTGPLPDPPAALADELHVRQTDSHAATLETTEPLAPLLHWLANAPLHEIRIEPVGLRAVYDRFHPPPAEPGQTG